MVEPKFKIINFESKLGYKKFKPSQTSATDYQTLTSTQLVTSPITQSNLNLTQPARWTPTKQQTLLSCQTQVPG